MRIEDDFDLEELLTEEQKEIVTKKFIDKMCEAIDKIDTDELAKTLEYELREYIHYNVMEDVDLTPVQEKISDLVSDVVDKVLKIEK